MTGHAIIGVLQFNSLCQVVLQTLWPPTLSFNKNKKQNTSDLIFIFWKWMWNETKRKFDIYTKKYAIFKGLMWSSFFWFCQFSDKLRVHSLSLSGWLCNPSCTDGGLLCLSTTTRWQQNKKLYVCVLLSCLHHMSGSKAATWMEGFRFHSML